MDTAGYGNGLLNPSCDNAFLARANMLEPELPLNSSTQMPVDSYWPSFRLKGSLKQVEQSINSSVDVNIADHFGAGPFPGRPYFGHFIDRSRFPSLQISVTRR